MHTSTSETTPSEDVAMTPGFIAFIGALVLPAVVALAVYLGAWAVSGEVYAADARESVPAAAVASDDAPADDVAGWKRALVGVCPIH